jgi:hypothetical protein
MFIQFSSSPFYPLISDWLVSYSNFFKLFILVLSSHLLPTTVYFFGLVSSVVVINERTVTLCILLYLRLDFILMFISLNVLMSYYTKISCNKTQNSVMLQNYKYVK